MNNDRVGTGCLRSTCALASPARAACLSLFLVLLGAASCGGGRTPPGYDPFAGDSPSQEVRIRIQNMNFYDARLTTIGDRGRRRLGTVGGNQNAVFTVPWSFPTGMRIEVDLIAGPTCTTEAIVVQPGDQIELQIPANLDTFTLCRQ